MRPPIDNKAYKGCRPLRSRKHRCTCSQHTSARSSFPTPGNSIPRPSWLNSHEYVSSRCGSRQLATNSTVRSTLQSMPCGISKSNCVSASISTAKRNANSTRVPPHHFRTVRPSPSTANLRRGQPMHANLYKLYFLHISRLHAVKRLSLVCHNVRRLHIIQPPIHFTPNRRFTLA